MALLYTNETLTTDCNTSLIKAIRLYQEVEYLYQSIQSNLSSSSVLKVMQKMGTLNALLQDAQTIDSAIAESINNIKTMSEATVELLQTRNKILRRLYNSNREMVIKANNVKSLLRHEITSIGTGHTAMKGYKPARTERKNIVRASF